MPLPGIGAVPPAGALYNELTAVTRRAFVRKLFVQIYFASPSLFYLWGNAQRAAGGLNQVTIPMQGQSLVTGQFVGYGGGFNAPVVTPVPADRADLKPGATVFLSATRAADGALSASRITVSKDGVAPPM